MAAKVQWWKNGDHPHDEVEWNMDPETRAMVPTPGKVVKPYVPTDKADHVATDLCPVCSQAYEVHGKVGRTLVHPGDFIITHDGGDYSVERPEDPLAAALAALPEEERNRPVDLSPVAGVPAGAEEVEPVDEPVADDVPVEPAPEVEVEADPEPGESTT